MTEKANVLAIDAASPEPAVALLAAEEIFEERLSRDRRASEELLPAVRRVLARAGIALSDLDRLAVCSGPGSFTGLRVGLATAWGIARGAGLPLEAVGTLETLAEAAREEGRAAVWTVLDAGRGESVWQRFDLTGPRARAAETPARGVPGALREAAGDEPVAALPSDLLGGDAVILPLSPARALALAVARAPREMSDDALHPIYARASAAEEKRGAA